MSPKTIRVLYSLNLQKQPPEVFCNKRCSQKFCKFHGKHLCQSLFIKKQALAQMFSCGFCEISKNTFFTEQLRATASEFSELMLFSTINVYIFLGRVYFKVIVGMFFREVRYILISEEL